MVHSPMVLRENFRQTTKCGSLPACGHRDRRNPKTLLMFKRILKTLAALGAGHGIQTLTQLLLPPAFIAAYGVNAFGEWLVLAAAVGYLATLDFGLQTYVLNELTMLYHRRDWEQFHRFQSVGLRLML